MAQTYWAICFCALAVIGQTTQPAKLVNGFETPDDLACIQANGTRLQATDRHVSQGKQAAEVQFQPGDWPNIKMITPAAWDWRGFDGLAVDVANPGAEAISFGIRVDDDPQADGAAHSRQVMGTIEPGGAATFVLNLGLDPMTVGMRGVPAVPGLRRLGGQDGSPLDLHHVVAWQVFMHRPPAPRTLILDHVRLVHWMIPLDGIVDEFGQYAKADWPGKVKNVSEFASQREAEKAELKRQPSLPDRDGYGGWTKGPVLQATGYFRTEKIDGKWWLVTPEGRLFWSIGMDCVTTYGDTITTGREHMFTWLPGKDDPLARHAGRTGSVHSGPVKEGATFNFLTANLERKYGPDYTNAWFDHSLARLNAWGFNTVGNWSNPQLYGNGRVPYVATVHIGGDHRRLSSGSDYWGRMHDPYDPAFAAHAGQALRGVTERVKNDPWCLGYFVDNELSWGGFGDDSGRWGLASGALAEPADSPAKKAFLAQLKAKYSEVAGLNQAWGTQIESWEALQAPLKLPPPSSEAMKQDMAGFVKDLALQYFRTVRDALRQLDSHHLYLGCRFAWHTPEAVAAAAEICDVVSFNIYAPRVDSARWPVIESLDKPCIIGEFHFGALDRGMFHPGLVAATDQRARAAMYCDYLHSALDHPLFVGCHWFQYVDEPLTGRSYDGENYNIGFITVTDAPYPEMVEAARGVHHAAYPRRWGQVTQR